MRPLHRLAVLLTVFAIAAAAYAQTTAQLSGTVTSGGAALPGVTVTISSPQMQGTRSTTTGDSGGYSFAGLPPGEYTVRIELAGMQPVTRRVQIGVGQSGRADADLDVSSVTEAITVTAAAPSVLETPTVSTNISAQLLDDLPIARTPLNAATLAAGVNTNTFAAGQLSISGSPGYDNLVLVNGVAITENVRHQALDLFIEDAVQETTVMTGGISAEYGGFTGGVVNSITKSGGNTFSGSLRDSLSNPSWQTRTPLQVTNNIALVDVNNQVWEATLGGFIMRDRLWFFGAGRDTTTSTQGSLRAVPLGDSTAGSLSYTQVTDESRYEIKLTGQITPRHNLTGSYLEVDAATEDRPFTTVSYDTEQLTDRTDPQELVSTHYNGVLTTNWMVEGHYSSMEWGVGQGAGSQFTDFVRGTLVRNRADSSARWNSATFCGVCDKETRSNEGWNLKTNYFLSTRSMGNHNIVGGVENFAEHRFANNYQSGSNFRFFVNSAQRLNNVIYPTVTPGRASSSAYLVWTPIFVLQNNESDLGSTALFINDRWDLNERWSFSLGARYDKNDATDSSGNKVSDDSKITPRLNVTYDLRGDGRHRFTSSYGQFASRIVDGPGTSGGSGGSPAYIYYSYLGPAINPAGTPADQLLDTRAALAMVENWLKSACNAQGQCGTDNLELLRPNSGHSVPGYDSHISSALASPYVEELTFGYGTQWRSNLTTRVDLISRTWKDFYGFRIDSSTTRTTDPLGIEHDVASVENTNETTREYQGILLQAAWRPRRFNVGLNYTWSTLEGTDTQETATAGTAGNFPPSIYYPEVNDFERSSPEGWLVQDQRHRARAWVAYDVPLPRAFGALNLSVLQNFDSGTPYSAVAAIDMSPYLSNLLQNTNYVDPPSGAAYFFSDRGAIRYDDVSSTNAALNYRYPIGRAELFFNGEILNAFHRQTVVVASTAVTTAFNTPTITVDGQRVAVFRPFDPRSETPVECPQGTASRACYDMGAHWQKGSAFGTATNATSSFQTPRTWRASVGVRF